MAEESDGIGEAFDGQIRIALAVAMQMAQRFARLREELARTAQARTEQQNRELQVRFDAERNAARASLAPVNQEQWWARAGVDDVAAAYETAEAWRGADPEMAAASDRMREELRNRYSVDVENLGLDPAAIRAAVARAEQDNEGPRERTDPVTERISVLQRRIEDINQRWLDYPKMSDARHNQLGDAHKSAKRELESLKEQAARNVRTGTEQRSESTLDRTEAAALLTAAAQLDKQAEDRDGSRERNENTNDELPAGLSREELAAEANATRDDSSLAYDSAERRDAFAAEMEKAGVDPELQKVRLAVDRENGTHPSAAVATKPGKQPKPRRRTQAPGLQRERGGLAR